MHLFQRYFSHQFLESGISFHSHDDCSTSLQIAHDITHVFIDSLTKIVGGECDHETEKFLDWLNKFGEKHNIKFTITISDDAALAPDGVKKFF